MTLLEETLCDAVYEAVFGGLTAEEREALLAHGPVILEVHLTSKIDLRIKIINL